MSKRALVLVPFLLAACSNPPEKKVVEQHPAAPPPTAAAADKPKATQLPVMPAFKPEVLPLPADVKDYAPLHGYEAMPIPADDPLTAEKAALGRQLYYDQRLSGDGKHSCYGCHVCEHGLTDGVALNKGAFDKPLTRSAPTLWNIGFHWALYWDGRAPSLEKQALAAWKGANMGADPDKIAASLNAIPGYADQFKAQFKGPATPDNVSMALASYMRTIVGGHTPWDRWQAGDASAVSDSAKRGFEVFQKAGCVQCHAGVLFTDVQFHNVGIGMDKPDADVGRFKVSNKEEDKGAFKTPTLRDIARSAPYFHDGSVATLEQAVDLMLAGGKPNQWLSKDKLKPVLLPATERGDLLEFLKSLDETCSMPAPPLPPEK
jgi:cytochrome c peroxidase